MTECPVGWKCVAELFCDVTATMVPQRVSLTKAQLAIRGDLIVSILTESYSQYNSVITAMYEPSYGSVQCLL